MCSVVTVSSEKLSWLVIGMSWSRGSEYMKMFVLHVKKVIVIEIFLCRSVTGYESLLYWQTKKNGVIREYWEMVYCVTH